MIARTVNHLVPVNQLKLDIFKKYVFSQEVSKSMIDIDALPVKI
jgi:hypothetical protein